jgi:SET domain
MCSVDASEEEPSMGRLVNHGPRNIRNSIMKVVDVNGPCLCLFAVRNIEVGEQITYDYGVGVPWEEPGKSWHDDNTC